MTKQVNRSKSGCNNLDRRVKKPANKTGSNSAVYKNGTYKGSK